MDGSEGDCSSTRGRNLLAQLDLIFLTDPFINELGFVHPSQLENLHSDDTSTSSNSSFLKKHSRNSSNSNGSSTPKDEPQAHADCSRESEHGVEAIGEVEGTSFEAESFEDGVPYDRTAFWCGEHKLAISMLALAPLYKCAKAAFTINSINYRKLCPAEEKSSLDSDTIKEDQERQDSPTVILKTEKCGLEESLMSYARALVLINCDHASAWNMRKQIVVSERSEDALVAELRIAGVVLSCAPKSEETWAHRRWVINQMITGGISRVKLDLILESDSKLVEAVAETLGLQPAS